jgi:hypothetical protein
VEYSLTERAHSLLPLIDSLVAWAKDNMSDIIKDRKKPAREVSTQQEITFRHAVHSDEEACNADHQGVDGHIEQGREFSVERELSHCQ